MSEESKPVSNAFAVVATASFTPDGSIVPFSVSGGKRLPVVLYLTPDEERAKRMAKRLINRAARVVAYGRDDMVASSPIIGVVPVVLVLPRQGAKQGAEPSDNGTAGKPARRRGRQAA